MLLIQDGYYTDMHKICPIDAKAAARIQQVPLATEAPGSTHLTICRRTLSTWNPSTKKCEVLVRQAIVDGPGGNKRFIGKPWQLID